MHFRIGVDGGGTKTELILIDAAGAIVARHLALGGNPSHVGPEKARELLETALAALLAEAPVPAAPGTIRATLLCMAGNPAFWAETAARLTAGREFGAVSACDDSRPVLELATAGAAGLVLHAGTGSFVAARGRDGAVHYVGGLGWKFGDPGSGFDLGRRAIAAALLELQERGAGGGTGADAPRSPLASALVEHTGLADYSANSRFFYYDPKANQQIAAFAPQVIALAAQDCGAAQQVVADSVTDFARQADGVIQRLFPAGCGARVPCGVSGRILASEPAAYVLRSLADKLNWPVELRFIETAPIEGVRRLLVKA